MKKIAASLIFLTTMAPALLPESLHTALQRSHTLTAKADTLDLLIMHTYGGDASPFRKLPYVMKVCAETYPLLVTRHAIQPIASKAAAMRDLKTLLHALDTVANDLLSQFTQSSKKDTALALLIEACNKADSLLKSIPQNVLKIAIARVEATAAYPQRFIILKPDLLGGLAKLLSLGFLSYVTWTLVQRLHKYLVAKNHEILEETRTFQRDVEGKISALHDAILDHANFHQPKPVHIMPQKKIPWKKPVRRFKQWWAQHFGDERDARVEARLEETKTELSKVLGNSPQAQAAVQEWADSLLELRKSAKKC